MFRIRIVVSIMGLWLPAALFTTEAEGQDSLADSPPQESGFFFPLPLSLEVGDRWTYSIVKVHWKAEGLVDTLSTETLTIRVVERLPLADQTYFALSDGSLYRVDEASRTWRYEREAKSEKIVWDIWGPIAWQIWGSFRHIPWIEKPVVIDGYACEYECLSRYGPFVRHVVPTPEHPEFEEVDLWITTIDTDTGTLSWGVRDFIYRPHVWTYADIIKFPDWGVTELYVFKDEEPVIYFNSNLVVAPNIGVVYYEFAEYFYSPYYDEYESMDRADSTGAGKVGFVNDSPPGLLDYIEKTAWILQDVQKGDPGNTVVEDTSWGQLKQRMRRPAPNAP